MEKTTNSNESLDRESAACLTQLIEPKETKSHRIPDVKIVLIVISAKGMVFDTEALRHQVLLTYPEAIVFFQSTSGHSIGPTPPEKVDLLIDFTGPGQMEGFFHSRKLRKMARVAVGRNLGGFRRRKYDLIYDEIKNRAEVPKDVLKSERFVQKKVLALAGISFIQAGQTPPDLGKSIALELPSMQRL